METPANAQPAPTLPAALPTADALLEELPWGVLVLDGQRIIRRVNPPAARWCGTPPAGLLGQPLATAPVRPVLRAALLQLLDADAAGRQEVLLPHSGEWLAVSAVRHAGSWVVYVQDVTAHKQPYGHQAPASSTPNGLQPQPEALHSQLAQHSDQYHALFYAMDQGFCVLDILFDETGQQAVDFRYLELNPVFSQQSGMPADAQGKTARELLPDLDAFWFDTYGMVAQTGQTVRVEHYVPQLSRWFDVHAFRVGAPEGRQVAVLFNDISERKQREASLQASEERQAFLLQLSDALRPLTAPVAIQETVTQLARRHFGAHRCFYVEIEGGDAVIRREAVAAGLPSVAGTYRLADFALLRAVIEAGQPFVMRDVRQDAAADENLRQLCDQLQVVSYIAVPVIKNGQPAGVLCLVQSTPRDWAAAAADVALAAEVADRTWAAVERVRAEDARHASEQRLRTVMENLPGGAVFVVDAGLRYQVAEGAALRQQSLLASDFVGRSVQEMAPPHLWPHYQHYYGQALAGQPFECEHEQGGRRYATRGGPLRDAEGSVVAVLAVSYDITARTQAEEALRLSEARLTLALQAGRMGSFEWTSEGNRISLSAMSEEVLGLSPDTVIATSEAFFALVHPDDRARHQAVFDQAGGTGNDFHSTYRVVRPCDGAVRWIEERGMGTNKPGTGGICLRGVHWDVTEPMQAQQQLAEFNAKLELRVARRTRELQASRDLLQSVFDTNLIAMSVLEAVRDEAGAVQDFRLRLVSRELARETNRTDLVGKLYAEEYPGIREAGIFALAVRTLETGEPQGMEYYYNHEGFDKWFACQFVKLGDGVVGTNLDITERKTAEQERLKNLRLLEQAEAVAGLGSWDYDLATRTLRWSDGMYQLFGLPVGSPVVPADYLAMVVPDDRPRAEQLVRCLTTGAGDFEETLRLRVHDQVKTVRMKSVVFHDEQQQAVRVLGVDLDISQLQRLEHDNLRLRLRQQRALFEAVQAAQEAERKRMADSLHNGIGQMLYATKLRLDQLHAPLLGTDPVLTAARREADHLLSEAIRQTRALSHELVPMVLAEFGLPTALHDICRNMSTPQLRLHCLVQFDDDAAPLAPALQMAIYRMAQELSQNIVKHAHGATTAGLELETMPGWVLLRAEDNGPGFSPAPADRPGLGLRSIRDRVALLGGQLETGAVASGGAYVRIRIPLPISSKL